jgi:uncharacterized protein YjbI with pentapeptide repeats
VRNYFISGKVTATGPNAVSSGFTITLSGTVGGRTVSSTTTTVSDGSYTITGLANGIYKLTAKKIGYDVTSLNPLSVAVSGSNVSGADFTAVTKSISGKVTATGPSATSSGFTITLGGTVGGKPVKSTATTASDGSYTITVLANGTYSLTAKKAGYDVTSANPLRVAVSGSNVSGADFTALTKSISGKVTATGPSATSSGFTITLAGTVGGRPVKSTATTASDGSYTITVLANGTYSLTATKAGYDVTSANPLSVAVSGSNVSGADFTALTKSISGNVRTSGGSPISGVKVTLTGTVNGSTVNKSTYTLPDGTYSITTLGNGTYTLTPSKTGNTFSPASMSATISGANLINQNFIAN